MEDQAKEVLLYDHWHCSVPTMYYAKHFHPRFQSCPLSLHFMLAMVDHSRSNSLEPITTI